MSKEEGWDRERSFFIASRSFIAIPFWDRGERTGGFFMKKQTTYTIYSASGNPTAVIVGTIPSAKIRAQINVDIMQQSPTVEQCVFVNPAQKSCCMAGGEMSGNGFRIAGFIVMNAQRTNQLALTDFGSSQSFLCTKEKSLVSIDLQIPTLLKKTDNESIYDLGSIVHVVFLAKSKNDIKEKETALLEKYRSLSSNAIGIIGITRSQNNYRIFPKVFVKNINTLVDETSCGSGTVASFCFINQMSKKLSFIQPTGLPILAESVRENDTITRIRISGKIEKISNEISIGDL
ncbi:MAG TPA: hypothetical protein DCW55_01510 [Candidatus Pacebacteria bacterium]|nr:MAG: hypothetical protein A2378_02570 [Candidatus Pacebacteria bacterium RIFOXYB1_FULL_44_10]HAU98888.1 hypothetical protein [Candidatus Paceibacterota bacterium]